MTSNFVVILLASSVAIIVTFYTTANAASIQPTEVLDVYNQNVSQCHDGTCHGHKCPYGEVCNMEVEEYCFKPPCCKVPHCQTTIPVAHPPPPSLSNY